MNSGTEQSNTFENHQDAAPAATTTREVSRLTSLTVGQIHNIVRRGLVSPRRGIGNRFEYSFQDIVVLRRIRDLTRQSVSMKQVLKNVAALQTQAKARKPLSAVNFQTVGSAVIVQEPNASWNPTTGQTYLDLYGRHQEQSASVTEFAPRAAESSDLAADLERRITEGELTSDDWFHIGVDLESIGELDRASKAYREAIRLDDSNYSAYINLGRLLQLNDKLPDAKKLYEKVLKFAPDSEEASYNLGTIFDTLDEFDKAIKYYRRAPNMSQAHHNLWRIYELLGDEVSARRHLKRSKELEKHWDGSS